MEGGADGERIEDGGERFGPTGQDECCGAVDDRDPRLLDVGDDFGDEAVREAADGEHGGVRAARARSEALGGGFGGRADEEGQGEDGFEAVGGAGGGGEQLEGDGRDELAGFAVGAADVLAGAREGEGFGEGGPPGGALPAEEEGEGRVEGVE